MRSARLRNVQGRKCPGWEMSGCQLSRWKLSLTPSLKTYLDDGWQLHAGGHADATPVSPRIKYPRPNYSPTANSPTKKVLKLGSIRFGFFISNFFFFVGELSVGELTFENK